MDQTSGTTPPEAAAQDPDSSDPSQPAAIEQPGFGSRGRARRRARFLRRARELAYRDLGGLVFNLHRFGQRNDALVLGKLNTLGHIDTELRAIEAALGERRSVTVLREAGITACPRCAAIHASEDRFCPNCGLPMRRDADLPIAGAPAQSAPPTPPQTVAPQPPQTVAPQPPATAPASASPPVQAPTQAPAPASQQPPVPAQTPSEPATAPLSPVTRPFAAPSPQPSEGRAPNPPATKVAQARQSASPDSPPSAAEESTEILRPQAPGS